MTRRFPAIVLTAIALLSLGARQRAVIHPALPTGPTFSNEVVRIFQDHCQSCHHKGDVAPFSLMTYAEAYPYADAIKYMTQTKQMPPWKPVDGCGVFSEPRVINQSEIDTIAKWVDNGAQEGDRAKLPTPLTFASGWTLGQPDLVLSYPESYTPPATGDMYRCFPLPTKLTEDQYVAAVDFHPGDRSSVHHLIAYIDTNGASQALDDNDPGPGYTSFGGPGFSITDASAASLGAWAPGARASFLPDTVAFGLPANSRVVLQIHYHPHAGTAPKADKTEIGIYFAKKKPQKLMRILPLINNSFTIPPNDPDYKVSAALAIPLPIALHAWFVGPHMHLLGKTMNVQATMPNGASQCLININDWDFNWQGLYQFQTPLALPVNTKLGAVAHYDNSANNWRNPNNPPQAVSWGEATTDEMCIAFIGVTLDIENLQTGQKVPASWIPALSE